MDTINKKETNNAIRLKKIDIEHYRGFYEKQTIKFAVPQKGKRGSGLTLITGPNNTGKTSIIEALLFEDKPSIPEHERHLNYSPFIRISSTVADQTVTLRNNSSQTVVEGRHYMHFEVIQSKRYWNQYSRGNLGNPNALIGMSRGPEIRSITDTRSVQVADFLKLINQNSEKKQQLNKYMRMLIPNFGDWRIETNELGEYIKYGLDGHEHQASYLGEGVLSLFRICGHLVCEADNNEVFIIDEPEQSLHPSAQKILAKLLLDLSEERQLIICTHSPYFAAWEYLQNGAKFIRLNSMKDGRCVVSSLDNEKDYSRLLNKAMLDWQKPQCLDTVAREILFDNKVLFVEGQEDVGLIKKWMHDNKKTQNFDIFSYGVGGASNMPAYLEMANDLGLEKVGALYDFGDQELNGAYHKLKNRYSQYCLAQLPTEDIRDKHDKETGKLLKSGIFYKDGEIKTEYREVFEEIMQGFLSYFG